MVKIEAGDYVLRGDNFNLWVEKMMSVRDDETMKYKLVPVRVTGYCSTYTQLLKSFLSKNIKEAECDKIKKYITKLQMIESDLTKLADQLGEDLDEKFKELNAAKDELKIKIDKK